MRRVRWEARQPAEQTEPGRVGRTAPPWYIPGICRPNPQHPALVGVIIICFGRGSTGGTVRVGGMAACGSRWVGGEAGTSGECRGGGMSGGFGASGHAHTIRRVPEARPAVGVTGVVRQQVPSQPRGVHWHVTEPGRPPAELFRRIQHRERLVTNPRQPPAGLIGRIQHGQRGVRVGRPGGGWGPARE